MDKPFISIVIPVLNGEKNIRECLDSIFKIVYDPQRFEVIVADNGSVDSTVSILAEYNVKVIERPRINVGALRNRGAEISKGDIIAFLDSDCIVSPNWLVNAVNRFDDNGGGIGIVGSLVRAPDNCNWVGKIWDSCYLKRRRKGLTNRLGAANLIIKRNVFEKVKGFDESLTTGEDDELCKKVLDEEYKIYADPGIRVLHLGDNRTLKQFFIAEFNRGVDANNLFFKHKGKINFNITVFGLINLLLILLLLTSIVLYLFSQFSFVAILVVFSFMLIMPLILAIRSTIKTKKWNYLYGAFILYLALALARGFSLIKK